MEIVREIPLGCRRSVDNKATQVRSNYSPALKSNKMLTLKMGWLVQYIPLSKDLLDIYMNYSLSDAHTMICVTLSLS